MREKLREKSTSEIASELEKMWQISDEDERIFAVKKLLAGGVSVASSNRDTSDKNEEDEIELLELAEELLEKLEKIFAVAIESPTRLSMGEIARLPVAERHKILAPYMAATAEDFLNDPELTEFSVLDGEDWELKDE